MPTASSALVTSPVPAPSSMTWPSRPAMTASVVRAIASASNRPLGTTAPIAKGRRNQRFRKRAVPAGSTVGMPANANRRRRAVDSKIAGRPLARLPNKWNRIAVPLVRKRVARGTSIKGIARPADFSWTGYALVGTLQGLPRADGLLELLVPKFRGQPPDVLADWLDCGRRAQPADPRGHQEAGPGTWGGAVQTSRRHGAGPEELLLEHSPS